MPRRPRIFRVALTSPYKWDSISESFHGVIEYKQRVDHWQLVTRGIDPIDGFDDIDLSAVDGVIGYLSRPDWARRLRRAGVAAVNMSTAHEDIPLPGVGNDDEAVGRMGGEHLLRRGFAHFGFVGQPDLWLSRRRLDGFRGAIERSAGRTCDVFEAPSDQRDDVAAPLRRWLTGLPLPIAVMAANDLLGRYAIDAAISAGIRVPEQAAVLGVDNDRWHTQLAAVPLSSVEPDSRRIGYLAAGMLDRLMSGRSSPPPQWVPPVGVVARRSTDILLAEDPVAAAALRYIHDHCGQGIGVDDVLKELNISRRSLELHLRDAIGQSPRAAIFQAQVERAKKVLIESSDSTYNVARACGFGRQDRFFIVFKRLVGVTPGEYRRRYGARHGS